MTRSTVAAIIPAAGASRRMGRPKLLIQIGGRPLIAGVVATVVEAGVAPVIVVAPPADAPEGPSISEAAAGAGAVVVTPPIRPAEMRESVELAVEKLQDGGAPPGVLLVPADSPRLNTSTIRRLLDAWLADPSFVVVPTFNGRRGHPVILPWDLAAAIPNLPPDVGVNALLAGNPATVREIAFETEDVLTDLDLPEDLARLGRPRSVRLFAVARERAGRPEVVVDLPDRATVAELRRVLAREHPGLAAVASQARIAVGDEYADDEAVIPLDASLALIPPVSGGVR